MGGVVLLRARGVLAMRRVALLLILVLVGIVVRRVVLLLVLVGIVVRRVVFLLALVVLVVGQLMVMEGSASLAQEDSGVLCSVLADAAEFWRRQGRPFYAVVVDGPSNLPQLQYAIGA